MWEVAVHTTLAGFCTRLLVAVSYEGSSVEEVSPETVISLSRGASHEEAFTRNHGSEWLVQKRSLVLSVPSVTMPFERNFIFNPNHPDMANVTSKKLGVVVVDPRFLKRRKVGRAGKGAHTSKN
jgi:RES domain-containing protein